MFISALLVLAAGAVRTEHASEGGAGGSLVQVDTSDSQQVAPAKVLPALLGLLAAGPSASGFAVDQRLVRPSLGPSPAGALAQPGASVAGAPGILEQLLAPAPARAGGLRMSNASSDALAPGEDAASKVRAEALRATSPSGLPATRRCVLAAMPLLGLTLAGSPDPASAAFGPAGGAVTSQPPLRLLDLDQLLDLTPEKLAQRVGSFSQDRMTTLLRQADEQFNDAQLAGLDALLLRLKATAQSMDSPDAEKAKALNSEILKLEERVVEARRGVALAKQLRQQENFEIRLKAQPAWVAYGAAALASVGSTLVAHPIDTLKTMQQAGVGSVDPDEGKGGVSKDYKHKDDDGRVKTEAPSMPVIPDIAALYKGLLPNIVKEAPSSALYLGIYEVVRAQLNGPGGPCAANPLLGYLAAGAVGELVGSVVRAPSEAAKTQIQSGVAANVQEAVQQAIIDPAGRQNTILAWQSSLLRDVPMGAIQIAIFELLKTFLIQAPDITFDTNSLQAEAAFGAIGGLVGALVTNPADVVTTRIITRMEEACSADASVTPIGPIETAREIYAEAGLAGFTNGATTRALYWAPAIGMFLGLYCSLRQTALDFPV